MADWFGGHTAAAAAQVRALWDDMLCKLRDIAQHSSRTEEASTGTARSLAYQYGVPPAPGGRTQFAPRSMTALPWIVEATATERVTLDVQKDAGRFGFAGYVANLGDDVFLMAWLGVDGGTSGLFTVPAGVTVQVPCMVRGVLIEPKDNAPAAYQVSLS